MSEQHTIHCDGYDRDVFSGLMSQDPALKKLAEKAARLLPHAEPLLCDLFSCLFKMTVTLRPREAVSAAVLINHRLMQAVIKSDQLELLRARTQLDEVQTAGALVILAETLLRSLVRDQRVVAEELLSAVDVALDEDALEDRQTQLEHLENLDEGTLDEETRGRMKRALEEEAKQLKARIEAARDQQAAVADGLPLDVDVEVDRRMSRLPAELAEAESQLNDLGIGAGATGRVAARQRLELGDRLMKSKKLQLLAKLAGAFREVAFEARRKRIARTPQELHSVGVGADLMRLLPSEMIGLSKARPALHLDFLRRMVERQLLQYDLHGASQRGPMVVCVDGSGSMRGSKELWAKAVALTLMEIARRERRGCLAVVFSSGRELFEVELLGRAPGRGGRAPVRSEEVLQFAECFPGGGTEFEPPLTRAVDAVAHGNLRRGDIVFITDGEAHVSDAFVEELAKKKKRHRFVVRGIVVDVAHSRVETLERFCDDVRAVTDLTADAMQDLFAAV